MVRLSPAMRISMGLASLTISLLLAAHVLGLIPDRYEATLERRKAICESLAIHCSLAAQQADQQTIEAVVRAVADRHPDILSAAVVRASGTILAEVGEHQAHWTGDSTGQSIGTSSTTDVQVPIALADGPWGSVQLRFGRLSATSRWAEWASSVLPLAAFVGAAGMLAYFLYLRRLLRSLGLEQSTVVPERIRATLNTLVEGVLVLDNHERIALANEAFAKTIGLSAKQLQGRKVSELRWAPLHTGGRGGKFPWQRSIQEGATEVGNFLCLHAAEDRQRTLLVNSAPIVADDGSRCGVLATFDDVTDLKQQETRLRETLETLQQSRAEICRQNEQLKTLAAHDPLTSCLNRRVFFERFETHFSSATRYGHALSCVMVDIDHFKTINDRYGHALGDQVLQSVAEILRSMIRTSDLICRYGGEEFCILLPYVDIGQAAEAADRFRAGVEVATCAGICVTASFGVSERSFAPRDLHELLDQADDALYAAKRCGRNRVVRWDQFPAQVDPNARKIRLGAAQGDAAQQAEVDIPIPFHAIASLLSALTYRDAETAEHSRRVADLAVATAQGLMSHRQCYVLEVAALLHDIGKIGVPDSILKKPGPLTDQEWQVMRTHEHISVDMISASFACPELTEMVRTHHAWYGGSPHDSDLPSGWDIPIGARIIAIADAYDAIVSHRVYRKARDQQAALVELRRCAGKQFDPELVERLIETVAARDESRSVSVGTVSKQTALKVGLQIEGLAESLDTRNVAELASGARLLKKTASDQDIDQIADIAGQLENAAVAEPDWVEVVQLASELLRLCRTTQDAYLFKAVEAQLPEQESSPIAAQ